MIAALSRAAVNSAPAWLWLRRGASALWAALLALPGIARFGILLVVVGLLPSFVNIWSTLPFEASKAGVVRLAGAAGLMLAARWGWSRYSLPALLVALSYIVSTVGSIDLVRSFYGGAMRAEGLLTVVGYLGLFLMARALPERNHIALLRATVFGVPVCCAVLLSQRFGFDPVLWLYARVHGVIADSGFMPYGTLGNQEFVASYLVIVIPITACLLWRAHYWRREVLWLALLALELVTVVVTVERAAVVALGGVVLVALWARGHRGLALGMAAAALVGLVALTAYKGGGSMRERALVAREVPSLVVDHPVIGSGPETFVEVFQSGRITADPETHEVTVYYDKRLEVGEGPHWIDTTHNVVLDAAVNRGLAGMAATVFFWLSALWMARRRSAVICAALGAAAIDALLSPATIMVGALTWILLGLVAHERARCKLRGV